MHALLAGCPRGPETGDDVQAAAMTPPASAGLPQAVLLRLSLASRPFIHQTYILVMASQLVEPKISPRSRKN